MPKEPLKIFLSLGYVPVVNENDSIATTEIKYGDNDRLASGLLKSQVRIV